MCVYIHMYKCVYMHIYAYIYVFICMYAHIRTYMRAIAISFFKAMNSMESWKSYMQDLEGMKGKGEML